MHLAQIRIQTRAEALEALQELGSKGVLAAGCTNILPDLKFGKAKGEVLLDIIGLEELKGIKEDQGRIRIGPLTTISELIRSDLIKEEGHVLWQACRRFGDPLVRNRATVGGNLANGSRKSDTVVPLMALDAEVEVESLDGNRVIPVKDFFTGPGQTVLSRKELIAGVSFKPAGGSKQFYYKMEPRKAMAISVVSIAAVCAMAGGRVETIRLALGGPVAATQRRAVKTEAWLAGKLLGRETIDGAAAMVKTEISPYRDIRASAEYRSYLAGVLVKRALESVSGEMEGGR